MSRSSWLKNWRSLLPAWLASEGRAASATPAPVMPASTGMEPAEAASAPASDLPVLEGSERGWLRVLSAADLLRALKAGDALDAMWRQSRLSAEAWRRDLLPAIEKMAEFVQLMPASESHHHAHAGGLLAHTLEMTLAAMTWRNGCLLPAGASIEQIDAERDQWTYVVFFAALLHDIAKPMTDLSIQWRAAAMPQPLQWSPISGSLAQLAQGHRKAEYRVAFTPRHLRDYGAHSRLALTLLPLMAPDSARAQLSRTPQTLQALAQYLGGQDKHSLLARIVTRADQISTARALRQGSQARFDTARSVPLIELLMQALRTMLKSGSELPLNRSGAAGWVHEGCLWLVAKRAADCVRQWIQQHAPEENIPGENKNDRLFDTWQEYGCIRSNPHTGQAVWYVTVHGTGEKTVETQEEAGRLDEAAYHHDLTVLCFALEKLYDDASQYPPAMHGYIEIKAKRADKAKASGQPKAEAILEQTEPEAAEQSETGQGAEAAVQLQKMEHESPVKPASAADSLKPGKTMLRAPIFNKPKAVAAPATKKSRTGIEGKTVPGAAAPSRPEPSTEAIVIGGMDDGFDVDDNGFLDEQDSAKAAVAAQTAAALKPRKETASIRKPFKPAAAARNIRPAPSLPLPQEAAAETGDAAAQALPQVRPLFAPAQQEQITQRAASLAHFRSQPQPVLLIPKLPELPGEAASRKEPSETALDFMRWLQQGLAARLIKYNETGAPVHFVAEGMALVSPLIFKLYAREQELQDAEAVGLQVQREVIKAGWHRMRATPGKGRVNILRYEVLGRGNVPVGKLSAVVLTNADRWVQPLPPANPVLRPIALE